MILVDRTEASETTKGTLKTVLNQKTDRRQIQIGGKTSCEQGLKSCSLKTKQKKNVPETYQKQIQVG